MNPDQCCSISLHFDQNYDNHHYNLPDATVKEIAVVVVGDGECITGSHDIIVYRKNQHQQFFRISNSHPLYPSLHYVLLFPTGQMSWYPWICYKAQEDQEQRDNSRQFVSLNEYLRYRFYIHPPHIESNHFFLAGKLFQAYVCESWAIAEQKRLGQLEAIQKQLRVELY